MKASSRYNSFSSNSSQISDPSSSSSSDFKSKSKSNMGGGSKALIVRSKSSELAAAAPKKNQNHLSSMVKKLMENNHPKGGTSLPFIPPPDLIAKKKKASNFSSFHRKLFHTKENKPPALALPEMKSNTRTLSMVLTSERQLLNQNKDYESQIAQLNLLLDDKNCEVDKLKDLCLKQREEIKALKNAILFPEEKHVIPTLQRQVTSLTGQLQSLAHDLKQVKADKYAARSCFEPGTPIFDQEASDSLEFSSEDRTSCVSEDDMFLKDYNPCLTPYSAKSKYNKEIDEVWGYNSPPEVRPYYSQQQPGGKVSRSSERPTRTFENRHKNYSRSAQAFL